MGNKRTLVRIGVTRIIRFTAFTAVIVFTMTAASCFGGSKPYVSKTGDSTAYTLTVTDNKGKASANPQEGDAYVLRIEYPNKDVLTNSGIVSKVNVSRGELELKPASGSETLTVTISPGGSMTGVDGTIPLRGGGSAAFLLSEGDLTSVKTGAPPIDPESAGGGLRGFLSALFGGGSSSRGGRTDTGNEEATAEDTDNGGLSGFLGGLFGGGSNREADSNSNRDAGSNRSTGRSGDGPTLTVSGLPDMDCAVYVFPGDTDLSNFLSIGMAVANQSMIAVGGRQEGTPNTFTMILWDEKYFNDVVNAALRDEDIPENITFWTGSGTYQVLLLTAGEDVNPLGMYRKTTIRFRNGSASSRYSDFAEVSFSFGF